MTGSFVSFCRLRRGFEILEVFAEVPWRVLLSPLTVLANDPLFVLLLLVFPLSLSF